uniref:ATP synthase F0 subunit 8 n=1 Tax=Cyrtophora moluccensis TaxID=299645 RepID=A0A0D3RBW9_9ARAC|nr:ATP synthase F0 subunit 8 [Cyrtophora moluccensis]
MPQLMPLSWISSSFMILMLILSSCMFYGEKMGYKNLKNYHEKISNQNNLWCW